MNENHHATWEELLRDAIEKPGKLLAAYTAFHNYSFGNALLALEQCVCRNLQPGPLNTYRGWLERKRQVRKGETGITLCMPMPFKRTANNELTEEESIYSQTRYAFRFRAYWFVLAQTEGEETRVEPIPCFNLDTALENLRIQRVTFDEISGNVQGFARQREIAINPLAALPHKTTFQEIAHIVLGHTTLICHPKTLQRFFDQRAFEIGKTVAFVNCDRVCFSTSSNCQGNTAFFVLRIRTCARVVRQVSR